MSKHVQSEPESFANAFKGIAHVVASERHMRVHLCVAVAALAACALLRVDVTGWCLVIICIAVVFAAEIVNSALEALCDEVTQEFSERIKVAKDAAAGAVLVAACASVAVGAIVYINALMRLLD